jgi:hypothetical protein
VAQSMGIADSLLPDGKPRECNRCMECECFGGCLDGRGRNRKQDSHMDSFLACPRNGAAGNQRGLWF